MLSKCANPGCSCVFRYLHQGKFYRLETFVDDFNSPNFGKDPDYPRQRRLEFFWLCDNCAPRMTLRFEPKTDLRVLPFIEGPEVRAAAA